MALVAPVAVDIEVKKRRQTIERSLFRRELADDEYGRVAGICVEGASLVVSFDVDLTGEHFPVSLRARKKDVFSTRLFLRPGIVTLDSIFVDKQFRKTGIAWETVYHQAMTAAVMGFTAIRAKALRIAAEDVRGMHDGYNAAARWGFNAPLKQELKARLPAELQGAEFLVDLMQSDVGRDFWEQNGYTLDVEFNLDPKSLCWQVLGTPIGVHGTGQAPGVKPYGAA